MWAAENTYDAEISAAARRYGVPVWVLKATIAKESGFDPRAFRAEPQIGDASRGLAQILERTARGLGYRGPVGDDATHTGGLYEPAVNIGLAGKLLAELRRRFAAEPWDAIYAAYNSGKVRRDARGMFVNSKGDPVVEAHVAGWRRAAAYFEKLGAPAPPLAAPPAPSGPASRR